MATKTLDDYIKAGLIKKGSDPSLNMGRIPIGIPALDELLGGGLPKGKFITSYGNESAGKTWIAQYAVAAVQKTDRPLVLYIDQENTYDEEWWKLTGINTDNLLVSSPNTAEETIDVMIAMLLASDDLGMIILDSLAGMIPKTIEDPETSSENKGALGQQAKVITLMFHKLKGHLGPVVFMATNQMRDSIGQASDVSALPGGRAMRHYSHIMLRLRRDSWITENAGKDRLGFYMEVTSHKNKTAGIPDGTAITLPMMFQGGIDLLTSYIEDGIKKSLIVQAGPYYKIAGHSFLGRAALRQFFNENPQEIELLKAAVSVG